MTLVRYLMTLVGYVPIYSSNGPVLTAWPRSSSRAIFGYLMRLVGYEVYYYVLTLLMLLSLLLDLEPGSAGYRWAGTKGGGAGGAWAGAARWYSSGGDTGRPWRSIHEQVWRCAPVPQPPVGLRTVMLSWRQDLSIWKKKKSKLKKTSKSIFFVEN